MFGSRGRGDEHDESDIDLAVLMKEESGDFFSLKLKMDDIAYDLAIGCIFRLSLGFRSSLCA